MNNDDISRLRALAENARDNIGHICPHELMHMAITPAAILALLDQLASEKRKTLELQRVYDERGRQIERLELAVTRQAPSATIDSDEFSALLDTYAVLAIAASSTTSFDMYNKRLAAARAALITNIDAYVTARLAAAGPQWLPIESAPKDGTYVLVANAGGAWIARYCAVFQSGFRPVNPWQSMMLNHDHMDRQNSRIPTRYMPLPAVPAMDQDQKGEQP